MKVSVAVITYRHEPYIRQALDSALGQQADFPFEVVVGDDASPDRTGEIVREYAGRHPGRVRALPADRNIGAIPNLARVLAACAGEYVAVLEGDDYWTDPLKLRRQVEFLDGHPEYSFCFHPAEEVDPAGRPLRRFPDTDRTEFGFADLFPYNFLPTCSVVFRRSLVPGLPDWMLGQLPGDWPLHMLSARHGPFHMLPDVMGAYRVHPGGLWSQGKTAARYRTTVAMLTAARPHFGPDHAAHFDRALAVNRFEMACALAADGDRPAADAELNAVLADPSLRPHLPGWKAAALRLAARAPGVIRAAVAVRRRLAGRRHLVRRAAVS